MNCQWKIFFVLLITMFIFSYCNESVTEEIKEVSSELNEEKADLNTAHGHHHGHHHDHDHGHHHGHHHDHHHEHHHGHHHGHDHDHHHGHHHGHDHGHHHGHDHNHDHDHHHEEDFDEESAVKAIIHEVGLDNKEKLTREDFRLFMEKLMSKNEDMSNLSDNEKELVKFVIDKAVTSVPEEMTKEELVELVKSDKLRTILTEAVAEKLGVNVNDLMNGGETEEEGEEEPEKETEKVESSEEKGDL